MFERHHGTAPPVRRADTVNPGSADPVGRNDAASHGLELKRADLIVVKSTEAATGDKAVTH